MKISWPANRFVMIENWLFLLGISFNSNRKGQEIFYNRCHEFSHIFLTLFSSEYQIRMYFMIHLRIQNKIAISTLKDTHFDTTRIQESIMRQGNITKTINRHEGHDKWWNNNQVFWKCIKTTYKSWDIKISIFHDGDCWNRD